MADITLPAPASGELPRRRPKGDAATLDAGSVPGTRIASDPGVTMAKNAFGDGEGLTDATKGVSAFGEDVYRAGLRQQKLYDANETTKASLAYDDVSMKEWDKRQVQDDPTRPDYEKDFSGWLGERAAEHVAALPEGVSEEGRQKLTLALASKKQTLADAAGRLTLQASQQKGLDLIGELGNQAAAQAARDPQLLEGIIEAHRADLAKYKGVLTPNQERDSERKNIGKIVSAAIEGHVQQGDYAAAAALIDGGRSKAATPTQPGTGAVAISPDARLATVNNNPGNLKFVGQDGATMGESGFAKFESPEAGYAALQAQIKLDASRGLTLAGYISKAAPAWVTDTEGNTRRENDTEGYTRNAVKALGVSADTRLKDIPTDKVAAFVAKQESGTVVGASSRSAEAVGGAETLPGAPQPAGKYDAYIDVSKASNYVTTQQRVAVAANDAEQKRIDAAADKRDTEAAQKAADAVVKQLAIDPTKVNPLDIANDKSIPASKWQIREHLIKMTEAALAQDADKATKTYGPGFYDLYKRIHAPDGDPSKLTDPSVLYALATPSKDANGNTVDPILTVSGVDKLKAEIEGRRTPEGEAEATMKKTLLANAHSQFVHPMAGIGSFKDSKGEEIYLKWLADALPAYDKGKAAGKTPAQLLNPESPDYVGKSIAGMKRSLAQIAADFKAENGAPAEAVDLSSPEKLADALRRSLITREDAEREAIARKYIVPRSAPTAAPISSGPVLAPPIR